MASASDNFNRADGALGANWTGNGGTVSIVSNTAAGGSALAHSAARYSAVTWADNQEISATIVSLSGTIGVAGRLSTSGTTATYYVALADTSQTLLYKVVAATPSILAGVLTSWVPGDTITLRLVGTSLEARRNGSVVATATDASIASGAAGVGFYHTGGRIDDWTATDLTPPTAPSGLAATATGITAISLSWTDNSSDETGFKIERAPDGVTFAQIATVGAGVTTYGDTGLTGAATYTYRVRAYNNNGNSSYSATAAATTDTPPPTLLVEMALGDDALTASPTYTDVTSRVRVDQPVVIQRGQNTELGRVEGGSATLAFDNRDRAFDPDYTSSPYYPNVVPMCPLRISSVRGATTDRLFTGFVEVLQPIWGDGGSRDHMVAVRATDGIAYLARQPQGLDLHRSWVIARNPSAYTDTTSTDVSGGRVALVRIPEGVPTTIDVEIRGTNYTTGTNQTEVYTLTTANAQAGVTGTVPLTSVTRIAIDNGTQGDAVAGRTIEIYLYPTYPAARSDVHIGWALDIAEWSSGARSLQAGQTTCTGWTAQVPGLDYQRGNIADGDSALSAIQRVVESESGVLFINGAGSVVFQSRYHRVLNRTPLATLGSGSGEVPVKLERPPALEVASLRNIARITPEGGSTQVASDAASVARYGRWPYAKGGLLIATSEAIDLANYVVMRGKTPRTRVPQATLVGGDAPWATMLQGEIGNCYTLRQRPPNVGGAVDKLVYLETIRLVIARGEWSATWGFSEADPTTFWILGDSTYGVLGTTTIAGY